MQHIHITVFGRVQGVFFRHHTKQMAEMLNIKGIVQNQDDGTVRIEAEGEKEQLQKFIKWCQEGPDAANVDNVEHHIGALKNYDTFEIVT